MRFLRRSAFPLMVAMSASLAAIVAHASLDAQAPAPGAKQQPNILLIVADDLGYSDLGVYGSEINTPNLDALAKQGLQFTGFHVQASCSPTRSMLLSGVDNHLNGMGTMAEDRMAHHQNLPGYIGHLNNRVVTIAKRLQSVGYGTYMSGKWHLGKAENLRPHARGFSHSFAMLDGVGSHYDQTGVNSNVPHASYTRDGKLISRPPGYSSDLFTQELIKQLKHSPKEQPFFAYLAFNAPHWPLQAPEKNIDKYQGVYQQGWDHIRRQRFESMKTKGLLPKHEKYRKRLAEVPAWDALSSQEQALETKRMQVYAAMVDRMDEALGSLLRYLRDSGQYDNTFIVFMSDNGSDPYDRSERPAYKRWLEYFDNSERNLGQANSYAFQGTGWAQVSVANLKDYKFLPSEGGTRSPLIIRAPKSMQLEHTGKPKTAFFSLLDMAPSFWQLAGQSQSKQGFDNKLKMKGRSIIPYIEGKSSSVYGNSEAVSFELFGHASVYLGDWKAVSIRPPFGDGHWQLYNLGRDPSELHDQAKKQPKLLRKIKRAYQRYKRENQVIEEPVGVTAYPSKPAYRAPLGKQGL